MHRFALFVCSLAATLSPALALAHPGHGSGGGHDLLHYLSEPLHASLLAGAPLAALALVLVWRRRRSRG